MKIKLKFITSKANSKSKSGIKVKSQKQIVTDEQLTMQIVMSRQQTIRPTNCECSMQLQLREVTNQHKLQWSISIHSFSNQMSTVTITHPNRCYCNTLPTLTRYIETNAINSTRVLRFPYIYCNAESQKLRKTTNRDHTTAQQNLQSSPEYGAISMVENAM